MPLTRRALFGLQRPADLCDIAAGPPLLRVHRTAMACRVEVALRPPDSAHIPAARAALDEADRVASLLTMYCEASELARINREAAVGAKAVDAEVFGLLERCARIHADTGGAFDISSSPLSACWGFHARNGRPPEPADLAAARACVGMPNVGLDRAARSVRFAVAGMHVNLNAIGKGYALDCMVKLLRNRGVSRALVSAGGSSIVAIGGEWPVDVKSPIVGPSRLVRVWLKGCALGTSGAGEQFVMHDGVRYGHVIDPRTGWPAAGVVSCSVAAPDAAMADALSTAFLVAGADAAARYCEEHAGTMALLTLEGRTRPIMVGHSGGARVER